MTEEEFYIWKARIIPPEHFPRRYERLRGVGEPFLTAPAAHNKIMELKATQEYKEVILQVSDKGGFVEYPPHPQHARQG
jgi:hypothetical protein